MNGDAQVAERFHPPQEIADEYNVVHLRDVFIYHVLDAECVDAELLIVLELPPGNLNK